MLTKMLELYHLKLYMRSTHTRVNKEKIQEARKIARKLGLPLLSLVNEGIDYIISKYWKER